MAAGGVSSASAGGGGRSRVAAFDVDGTLTLRDCVVPFLRRTAGTGGLLAKMAPHIAPLTLSGLRRDRDRVKAIASKAAFAGRLDRVVGRDAEEFAGHVADRWLRRDTLAELRRQQRDGAAIVFVSASYELYLRPLAARLGADAVVATRLEVDELGRFTGDLDGANCRGAEKVRRLHAWLDAQFGGRDAVTLTAYGDSAGDLELLADADEGIWVGEREHAPVGTQIFRSVA